jgi:hypothetical protein
VATYADILEFSKSRGFFESFRYTYGSWAKAAKAMHTSPEYLRKLSDRNLQFGGVTPTDPTVRKIQTMLKHVGPRKLEVAKRWPVVRQSTTPRQREKYIKPNVAKGLKQQRYFMEQVEKWKVNRPVRYHGGQFYDNKLMAEYRYRWRLKNRRDRASRRRMKDARVQIQRAKVRWGGR